MSAQAMPIDGEQQIKQAFFECMEKMRAAQTTVESIAGYDDEGAVVWSFTIARGSAAAKVDKALDRFFKE